MRGNKNLIKNIDVIMIFDQSDKLNILKENPNVIMRSFFNVHFKKTTFDTWSKVVFFLKNFIKNIKIKQLKKF